MRKKKNIVKAKPVKIKKILVPLDFSECSSNALRKAITVAKFYMAELHLLHVTTPVYLTATSSASLIPNGDAYYKKIMKSAAANMLKIANEIKDHEAVNVLVKTSLNTVYDAILDYSKKNKIDMIIMGTHGTSGIKEFFAGSNAFRIVSESEIPVITVQKRIQGKGFKRIVLPIRGEINSRQKVNLVASLAKTFMSTVLITGYVKNNHPNEKRKVKVYMKQVEDFLKAETIRSESTFISDPNFTKAIIKHATNKKADLIAIMKNHDFGFDQLLSGPYAQQFVNHSKIPVLSVPDTLEFEYSYENPISGGLTSN